MFVDLDGRIILKDMPMGELEARISFIKNTVSDVRFIQRWDEDCPIKVEDIVGLVSIGVRIEMRNHLYSMGLCDFDDKKILMRGGLKGYERDVTLFHEIAHFIFRPENIHPHYYKRDEARNYVEVITEWIARRSRSSSNLLRQTIRLFKLRPHIYDKVSFEAVYPKPDPQILDEPTQLTFPFCPMATKEQEYQRMQERYNRMAARYKDISCS